MQKRREIFLEFVYYVFDSLLMPLIRSNFYVTESTMHRNRLFYFRHDVWRALTEPCLSHMKLSMFEEMPTDRARTLLNARSLGFSLIRLVPKPSGVRPVTNLRRQVAHHGSPVLAPSINLLMSFVHRMLDYEKVHQPHRLGSALFSVGDIYTKLKRFAARVRGGGKSCGALYFAKVDVQSCFDTIPQQHVMRLIQQLCSEDEYQLAKHAEIKASASYGYQRDAGVMAKPSRTFRFRAIAGTDSSDFAETVGGSLAAGKAGTVFVNSGVPRVQERASLLALLEEHVQRNIVKIGKKFFRQKNGIPQGSVVSSLLCNFFYADFEATALGFLDGEQSLLLRLTDDFLLVTRERQQAMDFLEVMHRGDERYGIRIQLEKSLVNFDAWVEGVRVPRVERGTAGFPYCGVRIDVRTLEIGKDRDRRMSGGEVPEADGEMSVLTDLWAAVADSLTVDRCKVPGKTFHRKAMK